MKLGNRSIFSVTLLCVVGKQLVVIQSHFKSGGQIIVKIRKK